MPSDGIPVTTPSGDVVAVSCSNPGSSIAALQYLTALGTLVWNDQAAGPCGQTAVDPAGNIYFPFENTSGTSSFQSRTPAGNVRWTVPIPETPAQGAKAVLGTNGKMYLVVGADRQRIVGFDLETGAASPPISTGWVTGLYAYAGGLVIVSVTQVSYYSYDGNLQNTYNAAFSSSGYASATAGDGTVFVAGNTAFNSPSNQVALEKVTPIGIAWTWVDPNPSQGGNPSVAATPDGGVILQHGNPVSYSSFTGAGVGRWEHLPTPPSGANLAAGRTPFGTFVDLNGIVVLPKAFTFPCASNPSTQCSGIEMEFVTQDSAVLTFPSLTVGNVGSDSLIGFGSNFNGFLSSPGPYNIAIAPNRIYLALLDFGVAGSNTASSLNAFGIPGLAGQYPAITGASGPPGLVGLGDSIAAGHGVGPSTWNPDDANEQPPRNSQAYPYLVAAGLGMSVRNLAISGACIGRASDLDSPFPIDPRTPTGCPEKNVNDEVRRLDSTGLQPEVITLTVGGNDIRFSECFRAVLGAPTLESASGASVNPCSGKLFTNNLSAYRANLTNLLGYLKARYPKSRIVQTRQYLPLPIVSPDPPCRIFYMGYAASHPASAAKAIASGKLDAAVGKYADSLGATQVRVVSSLNKVINEVTSKAGVQAVDLVDFDGRDFCGQYENYDPFVLAPAGTLTFTGTYKRLSRSQTFALTTKDSYTNGTSNPCSDDPCVPVNNVELYKSGDTMLKVNGFISANGVPHPNVAGQQAIADNILAALR